MTDEARLKERNETLDAVIKQGPEESVPWLRGAFHTHCSQIDRLRDDCEALRRLCLEVGVFRLTVEQARLLRVCRVCRKPDADVYEFGKEHAHADCLLGEMPSSTRRLIEKEVARQMRERSC